MLLKCVKCDKYTLRENCSACGARTMRAKPQAFSPQDKYGRLRRKMLYG